MTENTYAIYFINDDVKYYLVIDRKNKGYHWDNLNRSYFTFNTANTLWIIFRAQMLKHVHIIPVGGITDTFNKDNLD
jgi:hypothetical protein